MESTTAHTTTVISSNELLNHWQGHRNLTRRILAAFPEKDFFEFTIAGMRTPAQLAAELLSMGAPAVKGIAKKQEEQFNESAVNFTTQEAYLQKWDEATDEINTYWSEIKDEDFGQTFNLFGAYNFPVIQNMLYLIDNEIHHRGQLYVYLRALGIQPPFFWER